MWHVYIIECKDKTLYTGVTTDIDRRIKEHNSGHGGRFTRSRTPVKLVYNQKAANRSGALKCEAEIKKLNRSGKLDLISAAISL